MFWIKLLWVYPMIALLFYFTTGKNIPTLLMALVMLGMVKLSILLLYKIANDEGVI